MTKDQSREAIYGMPYEEWKAKNQTEASKDQLAQVRQGPQALIYFSAVHDCGRVALRP